MKRNSFLLRAIAVALVLALAPTALAATRYRYKILHTFTGGTDGYAPGGPLLLDSGGNLYGVTLGGGGTGCGGYGCGTAFKLTPGGNGKWAEQVLYAFTGTGNAAFPEGNLVQDAARNLYGFDLGVRSGNIFELSPGSGGWNLSLIWTQGASPGLLLDAAGDLYGFMGYNAAPVAEVSPGSDGWMYTLLTDKTTGAAPLVWDARGNLYGNDGDNQYCDLYGTAFQLTPNGDGTWTYHLMHCFGSLKGDGLGPVGLVLDAGGNAYGATLAGGPINCGTVYKLSLTGGGHWKETTLFGFPLGTKGKPCSPLYTLALDGAGNLYGMAQGGDPNCGPCGLIFKLSPQKGGKWKYTLLHTFHGPEGADPYGVILDSKGNIFGATFDGGKYGYGVAFEITP